MSQTEMFASVRGAKVPPMSPELRAGVAMTRSRVIGMLWMRVKEIFSALSPEEFQIALVRLEALLADPTPADAVLYGGGTGLFCIPLTRALCMTYGVKLDLANDRLVVTPQALCPAHEYWTQ